MIKVWVALVSAVCLGAPLRVYAQDNVAAHPADTSATPSAETPSTTSKGGITAGFHASDSLFTAFGDLMAPLWFDGRQLLFINPRFVGNDESEEELNIGLGYRRMFPDWRLILGANIYYDSRWTRYDNQFDQVGFGVEMLGEWLDLRANYYLPENKEKRVDSYSETTVSESKTVRWSAPYTEGHETVRDGVQITRTVTTVSLFERYEKPREGYDAELGFKVGAGVPVLEELPFDVWIYGGYFHWDAEYPEQEDLEGFKARAEFRVLPLLILDVFYWEDKALNGSDWALGARMNLPFDVQEIVHGRNPLTGALDELKRKKPVFSDRLFESVIRDLNIRMEGSIHQEVVGVRTEAQSLQQRDLREVLGVHPAIVPVCRPGEVAAHVVLGALIYRYLHWQEGPPQPLINLVLP